MTASYSFQAELWLYPGEAGWHFVTLPPDIADDIRVRAAGAGTAFGSIKVTAKVGEHSWQTSLFRDTKSDSYLLPVKKEIRDKAQVGAGDGIAVQLSV